MIFEKDIFLIMGRLAYQKKDTYIPIIITNILFLSISHFEH